MMLCQDFTRLNFEVDGALYENRIVIQHFLKISSHKLILNMVAAVVQATSSDITTGTFEAVGLGLHL